MKQQRHYRELSDAVKENHYFVNVKELNDSLSTHSNHRRIFIIKLSRLLR